MAGIRSLIVWLLLLNCSGIGAGEAAPTVLFMISEPEYQTETTLPEFAAKELTARGLRCLFAIANNKTPDDFPGLDTLPTVDLLVVSVRRQAPLKEQLALVRAHLAAGKPLLGIRTASHAFGANPKDEQHEGWMTFDQDVLGGSYKSHFGNVPAVLSLAPGAAAHPVLVGVDPTKITTERLYKNLTVAPTATALLMRRSQDDSTDQFVAWVNTVGKSRVFYTSLGQPAEFQNQDFRRLLTNAVFWAIDRTPPAPAP
ncbi:MAG TPA: ThuA domain-containing protein [Planctomycetota bacterium]|nr:ThuA domain-containing protein [Planctomycetota bacterium]